MVNEGKLKKVLTPEILIDLYHHQKLSLREIANIYKTAKYNIAYWMQKWNIPRRTYLAGKNVAIAKQAPKRPRSPSIGASIVAEDLHSDFNNPVKVKPKTRILVLADMHLGSIEGIWPPNFKLRDGRIVKLNEVQESLWESWEKFQDEIGGYDYVILNGDIIAGVIAALKGVDMVTIDMDEQRNAVYQMLNPLIEDRPVFVLTGTEAHELRWAKAHRQLAEMFKRGYYGYIDLDLVAGDFVINVQHGSTKAYIYQAMLAQREILFAFEAYGTEKALKPDLIVRSHIHKYIELKTEAIKYLFTPCWQAQTPYMLFRSKYKLQPTIGGCVIEIGKKIHVETFSYPTPKFSISLIDLEEFRKKEKSKPKQA